MENNDNVKIGIIQRMYFPNLNGLRFLAAFLVLIHHIEQFKKLLNLPNFFHVPFVNNAGKIGVNLFFVLSGFLITNLLINEKQRTNTISVLNFYKRRVLRIWPLYLFLCLLSFFILPHISFFNIEGLSDKLDDNFIIKLVLYVFFLPNLALGLFPAIPYASQMWSIGFEEQFYLFWPWFVKKIKKIRLVILLIPLVFVTLNILVYLFFKDFLTQLNLYESVRYLFDFPSYDSIAIGCGFAYIVENKNKLLAFLFQKSTQIITYFFVIFLIVFGIKVPFFNNQLFSVLFGIIIINLALNKKNIFNYLENSTFNYLGKITYGIYMFHYIAIIFVLKTLQNYGIKNMIAEYVLSFVLTVIFAVLSYEFFEKRFIKLKKNYKN